MVNQLPQNAAPPSVYDYIAARVGAAFRVAENRVTEKVDNKPTLIARQDPSRFGLLIANPASSGRLYVARTRLVSTSRGAPLTAGGSLSFNAEWDFTIAALEWWAIGESAGQPIYVLETLLAQD